MKWKELDLQLEFAADGSWVASLLPKVSDLLQDVLGRLCRPRPCCHSWGTGGSVLETVIFVVSTWIGRDRESLTGAALQDDVQLPRWPSSWNAELKLQDSNVFQATRLRAAGNCGDYLTPVGFKRRDWSRRFKLGAEPSLSTYNIAVFLFHHDGNMTIESPLGKYVFPQNHGSWSHSPLHRKGSYDS